MANNQPTYALVQLADDPNQTILYVPQYAFGKDAHFLQLGTHNKQQMRCMYAPNHHLPSRWSDFDAAPQQKAFEPTRCNVVYNVRVLDVFTAADSGGCDREHLTAPVAAYTADASADPLLQCVRGISTEVYTKEVATAIQTARDLLLRQQWHELLAAHGWEIREQLLYHFFRYSGEGKSRVQAAEVGVLAYMQLVDYEQRSEFARRLISSVHNYARWEELRVPMRARCWSLLATISWLTGVEDVCEVAELLAELSSIVVRPAPKNQGSPSDWWQMQCSAAQALGVMVTMLRPEHLCLMWENASPIVPSLKQLLDVLNDSRRLELRLRIAVLILINLETGRQHDSDWFEDKVPTIREAFTTALAGTKTMRIDDLSESEQAKRLKVLRCVHSDPEFKLRPESQQFGLMEISTWAGFEQYESLGAIYGEEHFEAQLRDNVFLRMALTIIE